ncbi:RNA polymerase sigma factor [Streptomyces sp. NPDC090026]|uniref:RNA polymerase sigma factor n=1 Tax=Streptomyces sp. NPDC090026 TaxID=3365923 RepID=UPI0038098DF7
MVRWRERRRAVEEIPPTVARDTGRIRAVLLMSGMPWQELDDGVQQVRMKFLEAQADPGQADIRDVSAWVAVVASRVAADWHRGRAKDMGLRERLAARWALRPAEHPQEHRDLALTVAGGLERLTPVQRQVLVLRYYTDLPVTGIAELLGVPEGTVKSRIHTAVAALRTELSDMEAI